MEEGRVCLPSPTCKQRGILDCGGGFAECRMVRKCWRYLEVGDHGETQAGAVADVGGHSVESESWADPELEGGEVVHLESSYVHTAAH